MQCRMERDIYFLRFPENQLVSNDDSSSEDLPLHLEGLTGRVIASFFCYRGGGWGIIASAKGTSFVGGSVGILPRKIFKFGGSETLFSALVMKYVSKKLTLNMKMANILQVTIIKITDSKENKSIHRLNVSGSTGPVGGGGGSCPPCPPTSNGSDRHDSRGPNTNSE